MLASRRFERIMLGHLRALGYTDLRMSHLALIRSIKTQGSRTTEIAELSNMTKQAVGQLALELEEYGYIRRYPDPTDGRAKLVRFTGRGQNFLAELPTAVRKTEAELAAVVGEAQFLALTKALRKMVAP
jgi:DNA-binding MarR family transcriptional regulator